MRLFRDKQHPYLPDQALASSVFAEPATPDQGAPACRPVVALALLRRAARGRAEVYAPKMTDPRLHAELVAHQRALFETLPDDAFLQRNFAERQRLPGQMRRPGANIFFERRSSRSLKICRPRGEVCRIAARSGMLERYRRERTIKPAIREIV